MPEAPSMWVLLIVVEGSRRLFVTSYHYTTLLKQVEKPLW